MTVRLLERLGYAVTACRDGLQARQALRSEPSFDVVLTDLEMPGGGGAAVVAAARGAARRVIVMSGGAGPPPDGCDAFLSKPFGLNELRAALEA